MRIKVAVCGVVVDPELRAGGSYSGIPAAGGDKILYYA